MAYAPYTWGDGPTQNTPITAARLNIIENGIHNAAAVADAAASLVPSGRTVSAATVITSADHKLLFNSASSFSQVLPGPSTLRAWYTYTLVNVGIGQVTITTSVSGTVNRILTQWTTLRYFTDGTGYYLG